MENEQCSDNEEQKKNTNKNKTHSFEVSLAISYDIIYLTEIVCSDFNDNHLKFGRQNRGNSSTKSHVC